MICFECSVRCPQGTTLCPTCHSQRLPLSADAPTLAAPESPKALASSLDRFVPGVVLADRYRVATALGCGGMGEVYQAEDLELDETVALKFLATQGEGKPERFDCLIDEVRLARKVSHPNVCRVHDIGTHETEDGSLLPFISMEYIEGEDLASLLRRIGRLPKTKAIELAITLSEGLNAVHENGLLHRDIKPSNVMIDQEGRARLTDFGLAVFGEGTSRSGTPAYMAPELHVTGAASVQSDLYALGLVFYEMFTGQHVFEARTALEYAWNHLETQPEPPSKWLSDLEPAIERIILSCLEKIPERRPHSVQAVIQALQRSEGESPHLRDHLAEGEMLCTLLICDLVGSTELVEELGDRGAAELGRRHDRLARDLMEEHGGLEIDKTDGFLLLFERPLQALCFSLDYHDQLRHLSIREGREITSRVGIHFGEIWMRENSAEDVARGAKRIEIEGLAKAVTARLMSLAIGGQTLLSRNAFNLARRAAVGLEAGPALSWLDHGAWRLKGVAQPIDVFEVGREGKEPLRAPIEGEKVRRLLMQPRVSGWRPAPDLTIPQRKNWRLVRQLGKGGFGEVWLARHHKTGERRSFKFCFDAERLRTLKREITLFRLLKEELGARVDINRILDWNLEEAPYFLEMEYSSAGSLADWAEDQGGLRQIPLETRLELVAQVATALAAAHSVGVLHKDVKPSNVLIRTTEQGFQAQLADFGLGQVTERERLASVGITLLGMSEQTQEGSSDSLGGTRLYLAPELLEGRTPTLQADLYALGVLLYQVVVGDFRRALAPGWRRDIEDPVLLKDIAACVDRTPERRPAGAQEVAVHLRNLEQRRQRHQEAAEASQRIEAFQYRRKTYRAIAATSLVALLLVSTLAAWAVHASYKEKRAREANEQILSFMVSIFASTSDRKKSEAITTREILDRGAKRVAFEFADQPLIQARMMDAFGMIYLSLGFHEAAQPLLEKGLSIRRELLGDSLEVANSLHHLATLAKATGDLNQSICFAEEALTMRVRILGPEHPDTKAIIGGLTLSIEEQSDLSRSLLPGSLLEQKGLFTRISQ